MFYPPSSIIILPFDVHTYAVREGANPFTFPLSSSIQAFPISRLDNRAFPAPIMAKDKSFSPHSHYRPRLGWSVDIRRYHRLRLGLPAVGKEALPPDWTSSKSSPPPFSPVETNFCNGFENAAASISCRIIHIYIYIYSLVLPDYSFPGQDISQGELRVPTLLAGQSRQI